MKLNLRFFFAFVLIVTLSGWLFFEEYSAEIEPGMRQSLEEALVDNANLLAELVQTSVSQGAKVDATFSAAFTRFNRRRLSAEIGSLQRQQPNLINLDPSLSNVLEHDAFFRRRPTEDGSALDSVDHDLEGPFGHSNEPHAMVNAPRSETTLTDFKPATFAQ